MANIKLTGLNVRAIFKQFPDGLILKHFNW